MSKSLLFGEWLKRRCKALDLTRDASVRFARSDMRVDTYAFTQLPVAAPTPPALPRVSGCLPAPPTSLLERAREIHTALQILQRCEVRLRESFMKRVCACISRRSANGMRSRECAVYRQSLYRPGVPRLEAKA